MIESQPTALVELLRATFGPSPRLDESCWTKWALVENQPDFSPAIKVAERCGARDDLTRRLIEEHPLDREHLLFHDYGLLNFFTEVEALAWAADIAHLPNPKFVTSQGSPDLIAKDWWIEAKTINKSAEARAYDERVIRPALEAGQIVMSKAVTLVRPLPGLLAKFQAGLDDGLRKWDRQGRKGNLVVFYDWTNVDFGISKRVAQRTILDWAGRQELRTGARIVITWNYNWQTPIYSTMSESRN